MASQLDLVREENKQVGEGGTVGGVDGSNNWDHCQNTPGLQSCKNLIFDEVGTRVYEGLRKLGFLGQTRVYGHAR